ncbi:MAG: DUF501 domain-containing protein [Oceanospirillaceae bacterium]|nr:DUF501 domain-containing protein [Oceanospirillaceae bacterium]
MKISQTDIDIIRQQIGREPQGIVKVAARAANNVPLVLQMRSIVDDKPFPTLYWLCSKDLHKAIGTIETQGWVKQIEQRISEEEELRVKFFANHQQYVDKRQREMHVQDIATIEQRGFVELFKRYGIGGISHWDKVRCLHMQYAHHLVDGNVIGELLDSEFGLNEMLANKNIS